MKANKKFNTQSVKGEKLLCIIAVVIMAATAIIDLMTGKLTFCNSFALGFSCWICIGSWHILDDLSRNPKKPTHLIDMYLWPKRYFWR